MSVYPDDGLDAETLIKKADSAMYLVKQNGRQSYEFFKIPAIDESTEPDLQKGQVAAGGSGTGIEI